MSLEYPPNNVDAGNLWIKDANDTIPRYNSGTYRKYKTDVVDNEYGNGEYIAYSNDIFAYSEADTYASGEWPPSGAFGKTNGDSSSNLDWHTTRGTHSSTVDSDPSADLVLEMPDRVKLTSYTIDSRTGFQASQAPKKWVLYGRNGDGDAWVSVDTQDSLTWTSGEEKTFNITPTEYYSDYKISFLRAVASSNAIALYNVTYFGTPLILLNSAAVKFSDLGSGSVSLSQFKEFGLINDVTSVSVSHIRSPTMLNGRFRLSSSETQRVYFPYEFSTAPAVFITEFSGGMALTDGASPFDPVSVISVTTTYFDAKNYASNLSPRVMWLAVVPGTGTIHGNSYNCQIKSTGTSWGKSSQSFTYSGLGTPFTIAEAQTDNNSVQLYCRRSSAPTSTTSAWIIDDNAATGTHSSSEFIGYIAINATNVTNKMYFFNSGTSFDEAALATMTNTAILQNPICLATSIDTGTQAGRAFGYRINTKFCKYAFKEASAFDGGHNVENAYAWHMTGTTTGRAKPFWHLDANDLNTQQGLSAGTHVDLWHNKSERAFKYAIGVGKPTLQSDSNGFYVNFTASNSEYFDIPLPVRWDRFSDVDDVGNEGVTCFCVFSYTNNSNYARFFDFGEGQNDNNVLWSRHGVTNNQRLHIGNDGTAGVQVFNSTNTPLSTGVFKVYALVYDNNAETCTMYANNVSHTPSTETASATPINRNATTSNYIGRSNWGADAYLNGDMREMIVYDATLTSTQISDINTRLINKWNIS